MRRIRGAWQNLIFALIVAAHEVKNMITATKFNLSKDPYVLQQVESILLAFGLSASDRKPYSLPRIYTDIGGTILWGEKEIEGELMKEGVIQSQGQGGGEREKETHLKMPMNNYKES